MSVILSGKVEGQMFDVVNNCFGKTPVTGVPQQSATDSPSIKFKPDTVVVDKPDALQSAVRMGTAVSKVGFSEESDSVALCDEASHPSHAPW